MNGVLHTTSSNGNALVGNTLVATHSYTAHSSFLHHLFLFPFSFRLVEKAKSSARQKDEDATLEAERAALVERKKQNRKEAQEYATIQRAEKKAARERFLLKQEVRAVTA